MASMPITSDTFPHPGGNPSSTSNRLWACESPPALRTTVLPDSSFEQSSSIEGEASQIEKNLLERISVTDTQFGLNDGTDGHEMKSVTPSTVHVNETIPQHLEQTSSDQKVKHRLGSEGVESNDTIKMDDPVAMRTRRKTKLQHPSNTKRAKNISGKSTDMEQKSLLLQLAQQNKQLQARLTEMSVMLTKVLELQLSMAREIREDIEAVSQSSYELPLSGPKIMVKTQRNTKREADVSKRLMVAFKDCERGPKINHSIKMQSPTSSVVVPCGSEDRECGPIISIKMQSTTASSVIAPTHSGDCECGPSRICDNNSSSKSGINDSARNGSRIPDARSSKQCCQLQQHWMIATLVHIMQQEYSRPRPSQERR